MIAATNAQNIYLVLPCINWTDCTKEELHGGSYVCSYIPNYVTINVARVTPQMLLDNLNLQISYLEINCFASNEADEM